MTQKRKDPVKIAVTPAPTTSQAEPGSAPSHPPEESASSKMPMFWRIFGGAAIAAVVVVCVAVYQQMQSQISRQRRELSELNKDLRKDMTNLASGYAGMIKKEDHQTRLRTAWDAIKELRTDRSDLTIMKERCSLMLDVYKSGEEERRALTSEVRRLRESKTATEERDQLVREIRALRERIAQIESAPAKTKVIQAGHAEEQEKR